MTRRPDRVESSAPRAHVTVSGLADWYDDPGLPATHDEDGIVRLDYGLGGGAGEGDDSIRELLRQDEAPISGSACVD